VSGTCGLHLYLIYIIFRYTNGLLVFLFFLFVLVVGGGGLGRFWGREGIIDIAPSLDQQKRLLSVNSAK